LSTMPPRSITMATGPEGGGYYEIGRQYQELLARTGVELRLVATPGQRGKPVRISWNAVLRAAVDLPSPRPGGRYTGRPARPEGLDRTARQRLACASAQAAQAQ